MPIHSMNQTRPLECPNCGIADQERVPESLMQDAGFGMVRCPICGYVCTRAEANGTD